VLVRQNRCVLLSDVVEVSAGVTATSARNAKIAQIAALLARAEPGQVAVAVAVLSGELLQGQIGVGYATIGDLFRAADAAGAEDGGNAGPLTLTEVNEAFAAIGAVTGPGSVALRRQQLAALFARATDREREFLVRLLAGDLRQGALEGVMTEAVAKAAGVPAEEVRRAHQLGGSLPEVAEAALGGAEHDGTPSVERALAALRGFTLRVGRPAHARGVGAGCGRRPRQDQPGGCGVEDRRHPDSGAPGGRRGSGVHPDPGRHHRAGARDRRCGPVAPGDRCRARR
jgi:DNA ligase-1